MARVLPARFRLLASCPTSPPLREVFSASSQALGEMLGCDSALAERVRRQFVQSYEAVPLRGIDALLQLSETAGVLGCGSSSLNQLLGGGLYTGEITEVVGMSGSGKTQFCLTAAAVAAGLHSVEVVYVDLSGGFDLGRLLQIAEQRGIKDTAFVSHVCVLRAYDVFELLDLLQELLGHQDGKRLLIVDGVGNMFPPLHGFRGAELLGQMAQLLKILALHHHCAVLTTITANATQRAPVWHIWAPVACARLSLERPAGPAASHVAELLKSQHLPVGLCTHFAIKAAGVCNAT